MRGACGMRRHWVALTLAAFVMAPLTAAAQTDRLDELIARGDVEGVRRAVGKTPTANELGWIARAAANHAGGASAGAERDAAYRAAERVFEDWLAAQARDQQTPARKRAFDQAAAQAALGELLLQWAALDLDALEFAAKPTPSTDLVDRLRRARRAFEVADQQIAPLAALTRDRKAEDELLALGIYDQLAPAQREITYRRAWAEVGLARAESIEAARRDLLRTAADRFDGLLRTGLTGEDEWNCRLGRGVALRHAGEWDEAARTLRPVMDSSTRAALRARARYELGRAQIAAQRFADARAILAPLATRDPQRLPPAEQDAAFFVNAAKLWHALSYLRESQALRAAAGASVARETLTRQADDARGKGLAALNELSQQGDTWRQVVTAHLEAAIPTDSDPSALSTGELLISAQRLVDKRDWPGAIARLNRALAATDLDRSRRAAALFDLGRCYFERGDLAEAADAFSRSAMTDGRHARAEQAALNAYRLWAKVADASRRPDDYARLVAALRLLIEWYPNRAAEVEAEWWLAVALQAAGELSEAERIFAAVPSGASRHFEARYRRWSCARALLTAERERLAAPDYASRAAHIAEELASIGRLKLPDNDGSVRFRRDRDLRARATLEAAEMWAAPGLRDDRRTLELLDGFETRFDAGPLLGRVLTTRLRALRGLGQDDKAATVIDELLAAVGRGAPNAEGVTTSGSALALIAQGMQEELDQLEAAGDRAAARRVATDAAPTFQRLLAWVEAAPERKAYLPPVLYGLARAHWLAGELDAAERSVNQLVLLEPENGEAQRLRALILTERLPEDAAAEDIAKARAAWGRLLQDRELRARKPDRYWEARWNALTLMMRMDAAGDVLQAITQEKIWYPQMGGPPWQAQFETLHAQARDAVD